MGVGEKKSFLICLNIFWSYFVRFGIIGFCLFIMYLAFTKDKDWIFVLLFLFAIFTIYSFGKDLLQYLNCKTIYLTERNLCIKKYIGSDITLCLGCFIIYSFWSFKQISFDTEYTIELFEHKKRTYRFLNCFHTNIDEAYPILQPYIENYLINVKEEVFVSVKRNGWHKNGTPLNYLDFNKIEILREVKENAK
ncbi:hypothetical protein DMB92_04180 [Campylobacter sp. MIT 99-7217]|uniref:hypothetical protein n=1 Tax=Campylobacter sp. MIT 99-7217 TaxID=535091 RepID=UPI00115AE32E|nr:hypothetical protein [Campylobacter sp. MIT 99-7217]TQR33154.1 hypothetical protein DMB92_04180 [Campylobacter sp. MIT 99-7217]